MKPIQLEIKTYEELKEELGNEYDTAMYEINISALKEIERLNKELEVAKTNEETYRLEMLDITKRLGLDEETLFDDVKDKAERLNNIIKRLEEDLREMYLTFGEFSEEYTENRIKELKGDGSND